MVRTEPNDIHIWHLALSSTGLVGQVENAEVLKQNYRNWSNETEVQKWEEKPPISVYAVLTHNCACWSHAAKGWLSSSNVRTVTRDWQNMFLFLPIILSSKFYLHVLPLSLILRHYSQTEKNPIFKQNLTIIVLQHYWLVRVKMKNKKNSPLHAADDINQ